MSVLAAIRERGAGNVLLTALRVSESPVLPRMHTVNVELTNECNQKCAFCPTGLGTLGRAKGAMSAETFDRLTSQLSSGTLLEFAGYGEPFLHRELETFLGVAVGRSLLVDIYSNLGALREERVRDLLNHPFRRLIVSLDAMSREPFRVYKGVDQFERVRRMVDVLAEEKHRRGAEARQTVVIQLVVTQRNVHQLDEFRAWVDGLGLQPRVKSLNTVMSQAPEDKAKAWEVPQFSRYLRHPKPTGRCPWVWGGAMVFWNGDVTVCCEDPLGTAVHGNIHARSLTEILNAGRADFRRAYFADPGGGGICRNCHEA